MTLRSTNNAVGAPKTWQNWKSQNQTAQRAPKTWQNWKSQNQTNSSADNLPAAVTVAHGEYCADHDACFSLCQEHYNPPGYVHSGCCQWDVMSHTITWFENGHVDGSSYNPYVNSLNCFQSRGRCDDFTTLRSTNNPVGAPRTMHLRPLGALKQPSSSEGGQSVNGDGGTRTTSFGGERSFIYCAMFDHKVLVFLNNF